MHSLAHRTGPIYSQPMRPFRSSGLMAIPDPII